MNSSTIQLLLATLVIPIAPAATTSFHFNTPGDTEGFVASTAPANAVVTGFTAALGIDSTTGVLTSSDINIDPQVRIGSAAPVVLPSGDKWSSISIRFRQLSDDPQESGVTSAPYSGAGTILFFNGSTANLGTAAIATKTVSGTGTYAGDSYSMTLTSQADNWQLMTLDLSAAPTLNSGNITNMRFDPIGNSADQNFEIDFIDFVSIPEPSTALLAALASIGLLARRRR
jgi:hypothetical protein